MGERERDRDERKENKPERGNSGNIPSTPLPMPPIVGSTVVLKAGSGDFTVSAVATPNITVIGFNGPGPLITFTAPMDCFVRKT